MSSSETYDEEDLRGPSKMSRFEGKNDEPADIMVNHSHSQETSTDDSDVCETSSHHYDASLKRKRNPFYDTAVTAGNPLRDQQEPGMALLPLSNSI